MIAGRRFFGANRLDEGCDVVPSSSIGYLLPFDLEKMAALTGSAVQHDRSKRTNFPPRHE